MRLPGWRSRGRGGYGDVAEDGGASRPGEAADGDWAGPPREPPPPPPPPQQQHNWQAAVPDTALLPPPPSFFGAHDRSPAFNASAADARAGEDWCRRRPLAAPLSLDAAARAALQAGDVRLVTPAGFAGRLARLAPGHWEVRTDAGSPDRCLVGYPPLYAAAAGPHRERATTIYYEVRLPSAPGGGGEPVSLALGFAALPYPPFRLPGWHRGSLAVHGDDGRRFVNDDRGGRDFVAAFRPGDTYGLGMTLGAAPPPPPSAAAAPHRVDVFLTRNGACVAAWDLHEETDAARDRPVAGLEGRHDLACAVGTFGRVCAHVVLDPHKWMYRDAAARGGAAVGRVWKGGLGRSGTLSGALADPADEGGSTSASSAGRWR